MVQPPSHRRHLNQRRRITQKNGRFQIEGMGKWYNYWRDPYHLLLTIPWVGFVGVVAVGYLLINVVFGLLYLLGGDCLTGARSGSFEDAFFFSVHTLGSIGYGVIAPKTTYANIIVTLEAIVSLLVIAVVTGLSFARFSKPTARVLFSEHVLITPYNGQPTLMFRAANQRSNQILEAEIRVYLSRDEITAEGERFRRVYELPLVRNRNPSFSLSWSVMHPIDEQSPLYNYSPEQVSADRVQIITSLIGLDETVAYTIQSRHIYDHQDLRWDHRFVNIIHEVGNGDRMIDYRYFHHIEPIESVSSDRV
jgi:inward rectifier potassium channel